MIFKKVMSIAAISRTLALTSGMAQSALAVGFTGAYAPGNFSLTGGGNVSVTDVSQGNVTLNSPIGSAGIAE